MNKLLWALFAAAAAFAPAPAPRAARPVLKAVNNGRGVAQKLRRSVKLQAKVEKPRAAVVAQAAAAAVDESEPTWFDTYIRVSGALTNLFPVWTVVFTLWALKDPSAFAWLTTKYFTAGLAILMLSMGITLAPKDFQRVATRPNAVLLNFALCYGTAASVHHKKGGVAQWQSVRFACGKPRVQTPAPPHTHNSVAQWIAYQTSNLGVAGSSPVGVVCWTDWKSEGRGFDSRIGLACGLDYDSVAEWLRR